jgi:hypothetical protein
MGRWLLLYKYKEMQKECKRTFFFVAKSDDGERFVA